MEDQTPRIRIIKRTDKPRALPCQTVPTAIPATRYEIGRPHGHKTLASAWVMARKMAAHFACEIVDETGEGAS